MRPYRLIFYFFKCYLDRVQYPARPTSFYYLMCQLDRVQYHIARVYSYIVYYGYSMIKFTTGDMTSLGIIRLVMFSNDWLCPYNWCKF